MGAEQSAPQRTPKTYRGAKRPREDDRALERALELMASVDFHNIANARFAEIRGPVSWAKLGDFVCHALKREFAATETSAELTDAVHYARALEARLRARDGVKGARTTRELRDAIASIGALAKLLGELQSVRSEKVTPDHDSGARATVLRQQWSKVVGAPTPWLKRLMEETVAQVLASDATPGVKSLYTKALATFLPPPAPTSPRGEQILWDSDFEDD